MAKKNDPVYTCPECGNDRHFQVYGAGRVYFWVDFKPGREGMIGEVVRQEIDFCRYKICSLA